MLLRLAIILISSFVLSGCALTPKRSGVEIMSYPTAKVIINGKEMGMTPYKNTSLSPGDSEVKLIAGDQQWQQKIKLQNNSNTVVDWEFGSQDNLSGGYVLYMEKTGDDKRAGILVNSFPNKSSVAIDGEIKGYSPLKIDDIGVGDRQITISFPGYKSTNVFIKAINSYQFVIENKLAEEEIETDDIQLEENPTAQLNNSITIKETETGWLRVRESSSSAAIEVGRVKPKEKYTLLEETTEWDKIDLGNGKSGWISAKYAEKSQ